MSSIPIKFEDLKEVVHKATGSVVQISNYQSKPFSEKRHGIMGNHYIFVIWLEKVSQPLRFFVKTPPNSSILRDKIVDERVTHEEMHFFNQIYPTMQSLYRGEKWSPTCYLAKPEVLVFEDLTESGYKIRQNGIFDEVSIKAALAALARFHASSILLEAHNRVDLYCSYKTTFQEKIFTEVGKGGQSNKLGFETMAILAERLGLDGSVFPKILNHLYHLVKPIQDRCNVICHGDLWRGNIMFEDSGPTPKCILVDYQMLRCASPMIDVAMLIYVHTNSTFRKKWESQMLQHYYQIFRDTLISHKINEFRIPSYKDLLEDYERCKIVGMAYAAMRWPKIVFTEVLSNPVKLEKWYFHDRLEIYERAMREDPQYKAQMKEYLKELLDEARNILGDPCTFS